MTLFSGLHIKSWYHHSHPGQGLTMRCSGWVWCPVSCRQLSWGRLMLVLVFAVVLLQLLHLILLNQLETRHTPSSHISTKLSQQQLHYLYQKMKRTIENSHTVDSSGDYKVINHLFAGSNVHTSGERQPGVTLVSQCSVEHLHNLIGLASRWRGPISVAVFTPGSHVMLAVQFMTALLRCAPAIQHNVSIHLLFPIGQSTHPIPDTLTDSSQLNCENLPAAFKHKVSSDHNYAMSGIKYPNNALRNVALRNSATHYVFVIDIDMVPNEGLHDSFLTLVSAPSLPTASVLDSQLAYVVPAFESEHGASIPQDKMQLIDAWNQKTVRPFYHEICWRCQSQTNYPAWRSHISSVSSLQVAYHVEWKDPWEPFYIAHHTVPHYDERFKQYGFNRISQVGIDSLAPGNCCRQ